MNTLILYKSIHHQNTKKIAEKISNILNAKMIDVEKIDENINFNEYDLIGLGSGIYGMKHHKTILDFVNSKNIWQDKKVFIFSTSGEGNPRQHKKLKDLLTQKGAKIIAEFACHGFIDWGPWKLWGGSHKGHPNDQDLQNAEQFAKNLNI